MMIVGDAVATTVTDVATVCVLRSEEHTSELQSRFELVCRLLLEIKKGNDGNIELASKCLQAPADLTYLLNTILVPLVLNAGEHQVDIIDNEQFDTIALDQHMRLI